MDKVFITFMICVAACYCVKKILEYRTKALEKGFASKKLTKTGKAVE